MLKPEVREILMLYLEYYSRLWKRQLTSREFRIKHWLAREQFYRQNKLPQEINDLIKEGEKKRPNCVGFLWGREIFF